MTIIFIILKSVLSLKLEDKIVLSFIADVINGIEELRITKI